MIDFPVESVVTTDCPVFSIEEPAEFVYTKLVGKTVHPEQSDSVFVVYVAECPVSSVVTTYSPTSAATELALLVVVKVVRYCVQPPQLGSKAELDRATELEDWTREAVEKSVSE